MAFYGQLAPIVGQQLTLTSEGHGVVGPRLDVMIDRARSPFASRDFGQGAMECDLVAKESSLMGTTGYLLRPSGLFEPDDG